MSTVTRISDEPVRKTETEKFPMEIMRSVPVKPAKGLAELRDIVMSISENRSPVWRFVLAPDFVMSIQAKASQHRHRFECHAGMAEDAAKCRILIKSHKEIDRDYWKLKFTIQATSDDDWFIKPTSASWKRNAALHPFLPLRDRIVAVFNDERFDRLSPAVMLGQFCLICGKSLTDPVSQARLIGPECSGKGGLPGYWRLSETAAEAAEQTDGRTDA